MSRPLVNMNLPAVQPRLQPQRAVALTRLKKQWTSLRCSRRDSIDYRRPCGLQFVEATCGVQVPVETSSTNFANCREPLLRERLQSPAVLLQLNNLQHDLQSLKRQTWPRGQYKNNIVVFFRMGTYLLAEKRSAAAAVKQKLKCHPVAEEDTRERPQKLTSSSRLNMKSENVNGIHCNAILRNPRERRQARVRVTVQIVVIDLGPVIIVAKILLPFRFEAIPDRPPEQIRFIP